MVGFAEEEGEGEGEGSLRTLQKEARDPAEGP